MKKNQQTEELVLGFIVLVLFWNAYFFISIIPDNPLKGQSIDKEVFIDSYKFIELNITEENPLESVWQPIKNSLDYDFFKEKSNFISISINYLMKKFYKKNNLVTQEIIIFLEYI